ncbi:MAG: VWA-like domain-containing protein [Bacillota bacterium]|nr:VWA-like domain-containing protein [Bacillota bacterium]
MRNRFSAFFYRLFRSFYKNRDLSREAAPESTEDSADKYFSLMLGDFFSRLGNRDSENNVDGDPDADDLQEFDSNPLLDLLKNHKDAETQDMHENPTGEVRSMWSASDKGEALSENLEGEDGAAAEKFQDGDSISGSSSEKLGRQSQQSRISAKLNSIVSESEVPECVVFSEIGKSTKTFDWRRILRQNGSFDVDWSYRNAVVEDGIVRPTLETIPVAVTEILLDTSGSIDEPLLMRFLQECRSILPYSKVRVGCFDTQFYGFKDINTFSDLENMVFEGRHGTSFSAAVNAFSGRADNRIIFTDGDAPMPSQRMDIIWIVFGGKRIRPNGGRVFYVDDDLLKRLKS